jgi:6-pyruvoyltetrahydropterin/6-carboxytetrahydropterin synthase
MYLIKSEGSFDSAHKLKGYKGKCSRLHGHQWRFEATFAFYGKLDKIGISIDFKEVKNWLKEVEERYDHKLLVFKPNSTAEVIVKKIYELLSAHNKEGVIRVAKVALWETPNNCIEYYEGVESGGVLKC